MITILIAGITFDTIGTILIAYTAIRVHYRVRKERSIDSRVMKEMGQEITIGISGVVLIIVGYILQVMGLLS